MRKARVGISAFIVLLLALGVVNADTAHPRHTPGLGDLADSLRDFFRVPPKPPVAEPLALRDLPRKQVAPTGAATKPATRVRELEEKRTERTRQFELSDGRVEAEISAAPLNYRDASSRLQPIDTKVKPGAGDASFTNATNTFASSFGVSTGRLSTFDLGGRRVSIGVDGPQRSLQPTAKGSAVRFPDAFGTGADVTYEVTSGALKEGVVLAAKPASATFTFTLDLSGVTAKLLPDGTIGFFAGEEDLSPLLVMPKPVMFDSKRDPRSPFGFSASTNVKQRLEGSGDRLKLVLTADQGWLGDPARAYPVTLDPTIKIQPTPTQSQDAMVVSDSPGTNFDGNWRLSVGTTASAKARSLIKFDLSTIPAGSRIDTANLQMFFSQDHTSSDFNVPLEARRVTQAWTESGVTWNNINAAMGEVAGNVVTVDDTDTAQVAINGEWPASTNSSMTQYGVNGTYRFNKNAPTGETFSWVPALTESGSYNVEAHYVAGPDRAIAPYTVFHAGGQQPVNVNQLSGTNGVWTGLGSFNMNAGTSHKVVLGDVADPSKAVIADAVRFTKPATVTKKVNESAVWHSYSVRSTVQSWLDNTNPNYGFMLKAVDEATLGRGGPRYEAAEYAYNGENENTPKLVVTYGKAGVDLAAPSRIYSTGAELNWTPYTGTDLLEYQVHRAVYQTYTPSAATLVAPIPVGQTTFTDTTAKPTPVESTDPFGQVYYYMVAVKLKSGQVIPAPTQIVRLPRAGRIVQIFQGDALDTTLTAGLPNSNQDVLQGMPWVYVGIGSATYGTARTVVRFPDLSALPDGAKVLDAEFGLWSATTIGSGATYEVHKLNQDFDEKTATWNKANATTNWTPGGSYDPAVADIVTNNSNDPAWRNFYIPGVVQGWVTNRASNHGLLVKSANETTPVERSLLLSSETVEPQLRPKLAVTYTQPVAAQTYFAPTTPAIRMIPGNQYPIPVTLNNPTSSTWRASDWVLSYHWTLPDGTDVTNGGNQLDSPLPSDVAPGQAVNVNAQVKTPINSDSGNKRNEYVLRWELRNKVTGQWLSTSDGIGPLDQPVTVEDPTSDQLGLEPFYQYSGVSTGAGSGVQANLFAGNAVWSYDAFVNPSRGLSTTLRMSYNSLDTSRSVLGYGWSVTGSTLTRLGTPLKFHPPGQDWPTTVTMTDGDGTSHIFTLNKHGSTDPAVWDYDHPAGVHLYLQKNTAAGDAARSWVMTSPDRNRFYFDDDGYQSATADNNNELLFTYAQRKSNNKPTKFLQYITDPANRRTLSVAYYLKGDAYTYFNDAGVEVSDTNLTNPHIIDNIKSVSDVDGRVLTFTYTNKGLLARMIDGFGSAQPKQFRFGFDATQGNKNTKLISVTDPRAGVSRLAYYDPPGDDPKFHWWAKTITDRLNNAATIAYVDPDGQAGSVINTTVTDPEARATTYVLDGFGRPTKVTNAKGQKLDLTWDTDNNIIRQVEENGAATTMLYDSKTGNPLEMRDAEGNANGTAPARMTYRTGLNGFIADLETSSSPVGRTWTYGYDTLGNLTSATDPAGTASPTAGDFTTRYTYDAFGQLGTTTDANGRTTTFADYDATGSVGKVTDPLTHSTRMAYDARGNRVSVTDAKNKTSTFGFDLFGRAGQSRVPKNAAAGQFIVTPAPDYDANNNVTVSRAPNGAQSTASYDAADQLLASLAPPDTTNGPERRTSFTYDKVGNLLSVTEPKGNLTTGDPNDFVTRYAYDEIYQTVTMTDARGGVTTYSYDNVGNLTKMVDPNKNATADPEDFTTKFTYDRNHQARTTTDAMGFTASVEYDLDGLVVATTDEEGNRTLVGYDPRGLLAETKAPHDTVNGTIVYHTTQYVYDQVGNRTKVISPRGVETTDDPDDFSDVTVYDELNRVKEQILPWDRDHFSVNQPTDKIINTYDEVGNLTKVSMPPSGGLNPGIPPVRIDTNYTHFDNGWAATTTDPFGLKNSYDYDGLGGQIHRTITGADGVLSRDISWTYYPDGKLKSKRDEGFPDNSRVDVLDNSDIAPLTRTEGAQPWTRVNTGTGFQGYDYSTHAAGTGANSTVWDPVITEPGAYEVFVRFPAVQGAATNATYTVMGQTRTVNQTQNAGQWVSLGSYQMGQPDAPSDEVRLTDAANGIVVADAIKFVRDFSTLPDNEFNEYSYTYDVNGNLSRLFDSSHIAHIDEWLMTYTGRNQLATMEAKRVGGRLHFATYDYDTTGNLKKRTYDERVDTFDFNPLDQVIKVSNAEGVGDLEPEDTRFTYTPRGQVNRETRELGNYVESAYYADGLLRHRIEKGGALNQSTVAEHTLTHDANGNTLDDAWHLMDADNNGNLLGGHKLYTIDPRDRVNVVNHGVGVGLEEYAYDANNNVLAQVLTDMTYAGRETITSTYDRNRLVESFNTRPGYASKSSFIYDSPGRLTTINSDGQGAGQTRYVYDGFDRKEQFYQDTFGPTGTAGQSAFYQYDSLNRIRQAFKFKKNPDGTGGQTAEIFYRYLGASGLVLSENRNEGEQLTTYNYGLDGKRLSQETEMNGPGAGEYTYSIDPRGNVEAITIPSGQTAATYGYTTHGRDIASMFTGLDKPDQENPLKVAVNVYRFNAQPLDQTSGNYEIGFRDFSPNVSRFLTPDHYGDVQADLRLGPVPFDTSAPDRSFWDWAKDMGREFVNHIKEDPWQFVGEVAIGVAVGIAVGLVCTTGIGCVFLAGIAGGAASTAYGYGVDVAQGEHDFNLGDFTKDTLIGGAVGGLTAGIGYGIGRGLSKLFRKIKAPVSCHSFAAGTLVLMADGTTKRIADIKTGDVVLATDPVTGQTVPKQVTFLHLNQDWDLAKVTLLDTATGDTTVLQTTWHHPFWSTTENAWVNAADLKPGTWLRDDEGKETQQVVAVRTWTGLQQMHDLTVADIHTYYVLAGDQPVLVHNANLPCQKQIQYASDELSTKAYNAREATSFPPGRNVAVAHVPGWNHPKFGDYVYGFSKSDALRTIHSEDDIIAQLTARGFNGKVIKALYSERSICEVCAPKIAKYLTDDARLTYSVPHGPGSTNLLIALIDGMRGYRPRP